MKYRKRPPIVEAFRWAGRIDARTPKWFRKIHDAGSAYVWLDKACYFATDDGEAHAELGDWIIKEESGYITICNGETFERMFDPVEDDE